MKSLKFLFILLMSFAMGCSAPHQSSDSNPVLVGYNLIDEGRADEAIEHFQSHLDQDPESEDYRRGLSSSYALRGGFRIQKLIQPMKEIQQADAIQKDFEKVALRVLKGLKGSENFQNILSFEIQLVVFLKKFEAVPSITQEEMTDLRASISLLYPLKDLKPGDYLYMAVLEALILKHQLSLPLQAEGCDESIAATKKRIQSSVGQFGKVLEYLGRAQPSQLENYRKQITALDGLVAQISSLTKSSLMTLSLLQHAPNSESPTNIRLFHAPPECEI